jgi:hypothetical protein
MRLVGGGPSDRLLKDAPPNVAARSSFGGVGDVGRVAAVAGPDECGKTKGPCIITYLTVQTEHIHGLPTVKCLYQLRTMSILSLADRWRLPFPYCAQSDNHRRRCFRLWMTIQIMN